MSARSVSARRRRLATQRSRRRGHRSVNAQATIEMAVILPIMLALVFNFLGIMIEVKVQNELQGATGLAAQASLAARVHDAHTSCIYAARTFYSMIYAWPGYANAGTYGCPGPFPGNVQPGTFAPTNPGIPPGTSQPFTNLTFACDGNAPNYYSGAGYPLPPLASQTGPPITCNASLRFNFATSPLAAFIFWSPSISAVSQAVPAANRQCNSTTSTSCTT